MAGNNESSDLPSFYNSLHLSDVVLKLRDGDNIYAHKVILAQESKHFEAVFKADSTVKEVDMSADKPSFVQTMIAFFYGKHIARFLAGSIVVTMFALATKYEAERLKQFVRDRLFTEKTTCTEIPAPLLYTQLALSTYLKNPLFARELRQPIVNAIVDDINALQYEHRQVFNQLLSDAPELAIDLVHALGEKFGALNSPKPKRAAQAAVLDRPSYSPISLAARTPPHGSDSG